MADGVREFVGGRWLGPAVLFAIAVTGGCQIGPRGEVSNDGIAAVTLRVDFGDGRLARYETGPDGAIRFAGGSDVVKERFSWEGVLRDDERAALAAILDRNELREARTRRADDGERPQFRVTIRRDGRRHRFTADGTDTGVVELHDLLREAASRRFDPIRDRWPETTEPDDGE